jgi:hypothetical protein
LPGNLVQITDFARFVLEGMGNIYSMRFSLKGNRNDDINIVVLIIGMELERIGEPMDPVEGTNVTLICRIKTVKIE